MSDPERPWDDRPDEAPKKKSTPMWQWVGGGLLLVAIFGAVSSQSDSTGSSDDESAANEFGAQIACEDRVKTGLKSPSSAEFSDVSAIPEGIDTWRVTGSVDSDNSFGASIRGTFTCLARSDDGELWITSQVAIN